jgi:hypothetical protein
MLKRDEVFFFSLSARNKALTEDEREQYKLGRSEMFHRVIIRHDSCEMILRHIYRCETNKNGFLTNANLPYPDKCLTLYWNINPSNVRKVLYAQQQLIIDLQDELINASLKMSNEAIAEAFYKIKKSYDSTLSLYQTNTGTRYWIDFDLDVEKELLNNHYTTIHKFLVEKIGLGNFVCIDTKGGMHILIRKKCIKFNPDEITKNILSIIYGDKHIENIKGEIIRNKNEMIPLPGTIQCNYNVKVLNKDDFNGKTNIKNEVE